jgi:hypothetical protein
MIEEINARRLAKLEAQQAAMQAVNPETTINETSETIGSPQEETGRKRRRAEVDYAKLDQELFSKKDAK